MAYGGANMLVSQASSNRAPMYSDAVVDGQGFLNATTSKTITVKDTAGNQAFAASVLIVNSSGQAATVQINAVRGVAGKNGNEVHQPVPDEPVNPIYIASGESFGPIPVRMYSIVETNVGAAIQTGRGVRYLFILEAGK
jgi:hypothetical protein